MTAELDLGSDSLNEVVADLRAQARPEALAGMARYGITTGSAWGLSIPTLRQAARRLRRDHAAAERLWATGVHELRILASLVDDPHAVTEEQMERWVAEFDSWDVCDGCCGNLFDRTPFAFDKACEWCERPEEYVKRAGFVLMAELAVHDKRASDVQFAAFLPPIERHADDDRNFVKKAVNWALRQIGKRNAALHPLALETASRIRQQPSRSARWIAADAIRELESPAVRARLGIQELR